MFLLTQRLSEFSKSDLCSVSCLSVLTRPLVLQKAVNFVGDTVIFISGQKVLALGSCSEYESGRHRNCFALNSDWFTKDWNVSFSQRSLIQFVIPVWYCSHVNRNRTALRAFSSSGLVGVLSSRLMFPLSSDDQGPWDPRDPVAVEPLLCPCMFQDLVESGPLEPEAAFASKEVTRAAKLPTFCSIFVILVVWAATV